MGSLIWLLIVFTYVGWFEFWAGGKLKSQETSISNIESLAARVQFRVP